MCRFPAKYMVPSHGRPVSGKQVVAETLTAYRDAFQYVYDQTIRKLNKGLLPDDLVEVVKLPPHLANHPIEERSNWCTGSLANKVMKRTLNSTGLVSVQNNPNVRLWL
jgi:alkyl sulfatase BDS1-like metallo-beta-lactamase superfamily hydrolase